MMCLLSLKEQAILEGLRATPGSDDWKNAEGLLRKYGFVPVGERKRKTGPIPKTAHSQQIERAIIENVRLLIGVGDENCRFDERESKPVRRRRRPQSRKSAVQGGESQRGNVYSRLKVALEGIKTFHEQCLNGYFVPPRAELDLYSLAIRRPGLQVVLNTCLKTMENKEPLNSSKFFSSLGCDSVEPSASRKWNDHVKQITEEIADYFGVPSTPRREALAMLLKHLRHSCLVIDGSRYITVEEFGTALVWAKQSVNFPPPLGDYFAELRALVNGMKWLQRVAPIAGVSSMSKDEKLGRIRVLLGAVQFSKDAELTESVVRDLEKLLLDPPQPNEIITRFILINDEGLREELAKGSDNAQALMEARMAGAIAAIQTNENLEDDAEQKRLFEEAEKLTWNDLHALVDRMVSEGDLTPALSRDILVRLRKPCKSVPTLDEETRMRLDQARKAVAATANSSRQTAKKGL